MAKHFANNPKWLLRFAPFRALSISAAYLVPFFTGHGLSQTEIFVLQAIFSLAVVLWELPSGYLADKLGRARCIQWSAPLAGISMIAYGFSTEFWQFLVCELLLALANGFISGADDALLYDSLKASPGDQSGQFELLKKRINARMFGAASAGFPAAMLLVWWLGVPATLVIDGALTCVGAFFAWQLAEAPRSPKKESAWQAIKAMAHNAKARWLLALYAALATGTYMGFWLSAQTYESIGIPLAFFAAIMAGRNLWMALWSHNYHPTSRPGQHMAAYIVLIALGYIGMASGQWWWLLLALGHDIVRSQTGPALARRLNDHMPHGDHRATLNSAINMALRLAYFAVGPILGIAADYGGLQTSLLVAATICSGAAVVALVRLQRLGAFDSQ